MLLVLIGSLLLMGTAFALLAKAAGMSRARTADTLAQIDAYGFAEAPPTLQTAGAARGILDAVASLLGQAFAQVPEFGVWGLHIYVGRHNPTGIYAPWNPKVSCANAGAEGAAVGHHHGS